MITAKEACQKTMEAKGINIENGLAETEKAIKEAISRGEYRTKITYSDIDEALFIAEELRKHGYEITIIRYTDTMLSIKWYKGDSF